MTIIIDAMGGDNAPQAIVQGAVDAQREFGVDIVLVGQPEAVQRCLADCGAADNAHISVHPASEVITMSDDPSTATRHKKDASMTVALNLLRDGKGDAVVSAGSTGALLTGATLIVRRVRGIRRAALAPVLPNGGAGVMLIDCGANVECTPEYLLQFAYMGSFYAERILGVKSPRVALLNVGAEDEKGDELRKQTNAQLRMAAEAGRLNFIGNREGSDLLRGEVDVMVADGFAGNVMLKTVEGAAKFMFGSMRDIFYKNLKNKLAAAVIKKDLYAFKSTMDVNEIGGTALLGISRPVVKAHGSSDARAIRSAVRQAIAFAEAGVIQAIEENIDSMKITAE